MLPLERQLARVRAFRRSGVPLVLALLLGASAACTSVRPDAGDFVVLESQRFT